MVFFGKVFKNLTICKLITMLRKINDLARGIPEYENSVVGVFLFPKPCHLRLHPTACLGMVEETDRDTARCRVSPELLHSLGSPVMFGGPIFVITATEVSLAVSSPLPDCS